MSAAEVLGKSVIGNSVDAMVSAVAPAQVTGLQETFLLPAVEQSGDVFGSGHKVKNCNVALQRDSDEVFLSVMLNSEPNAQGRYARTILKQVRIAQVPLIRYDAKGTSYDGLKEHITYDGSVVQHRDFSYLEDVVTEFKIDSGANDVSQVRMRIFRGEGKKRREVASFLCQDLTS